MANAWVEQLQQNLIQKLGASKGNILAKKYSAAFPITYQEDFFVKTAIEDIQRIENLTEENPLAVDLYEQHTEAHDRLYVKLIQYGKPIPLSDVLPMLENLDLRTYNERPYRINLGKSCTIWISDFSVARSGSQHRPAAKTQQYFEEALIKINSGACENDGFNKLILNAALSWQEVVILRAYAKYLQQINFHFSQAYIERTLATYSILAKELVVLFKTKFNPKSSSAERKSLPLLEAKIAASIDQITSLDEDRILRSFLQLIKATLRTNYFQTNPDKNGAPKEYLSLKFASKEIPDLPLPHPLFEIFVYSRRFEAIHLRAEKVARGGIRWSERREDFRTEILGLMKAQKVKNAIIVPSGAKGGFVLKTITSQTSRDAMKAEVIACYKAFMCGLLDLTDNIQQGKVISPPQVVCYDSEDTYLVVAADKGTASFSDIANSISKDYHFWLGDAFASGGSAGYDHKKMGITARGAWESVKRHFRNLAIDVEQQNCTVVGIGDMSGDVFGNGMLRSEHIQLVAAFDHRDIFIDPTPNAKKAFAERLRLFNLPTSSWNDYNKKLISPGGGVFSRTAKSISLTPEIKKALAISENILSPNALIRAILKAPVDLLYNGGIGTYVKASTENHIEVGDKTNDFCRINGNELRCRVVGEGGNLGFTQLARIEYALLGGLINTDFIDNSGGVDCSDHEVNMKILLNSLVMQKKLTEKDRNKLLASMTNEVAELVLADNYSQALTLAFSTNHAKKLLGLYQAYLKDLEASGVIDRVIEFLPDDKTISERRTLNKGLTSPELAVLLSYSKIHIKNEILKSDIPEDFYFDDMLEKDFPKKLVKLYGKQLQTHPLRREITATQISNQIVNEMGITFVYRLQTETGATPGEIIRAYTAASRVFGTLELQQLVDSLGPHYPANSQYELLHYVRSLTNLSTRWFLRNNRLKGNLADIIEHYSKRVKMLEKVLPSLMAGVTKSYMENIKDSFLKSGISPNIAHRIAVTRAIYTALNIIEVSTAHKFDLHKTARIYFDVGTRFNLVWFRDQISQDYREGHWNTLARLTLRDELDILQKTLAVAIMKHDKNKTKTDTTAMINCWSESNHRAVARWDKVMELLYNAPAVDYASFFIAVRELSNWVSGEAS